LRFGGLGLAASSSIACSRLTALFLFVACDRDPPSTMRTSLPRFPAIRSLVCSSKARDARTSNLSSTRVALVLACWPPGPPDVSKRQR